MNRQQHVFELAAWGALSLTALAVSGCSERNPLGLDQVSDRLQLNTSAYAASSIVLDFDDGLLPSAHGWTFRASSPIVETQVAFVSDGYLFFDTTPITSDVEAHWAIPLSPIDPANYVMEIRMRAFLPDGIRSHCTGWLGAIFEVQGNHVTSLSLMPRQLSVSGLPGETCPHQINLLTDGRTFHTYKVEVRNSNQATIFVDDSPVATGTLFNPWPQHEIYFGDGSPTGGNVKVEVDFLRVASLAKTVGIDIKPGSYPNSINLGSNGTVPVAIFSTETFDATTVDATTVTLADATVKVKGKGTPMAAEEDVNGDGLMDLVVHVETEGLSLTEGDTEAVLTATTQDGTEIRGTDTVRVVP